MKILSGVGSCARSTEQIRLHVDIWNGRKVISNERRRPSNYLKVYRLACVTHGKSKEALRAEERWNKNIQLTDKVGT